MARQGRKSLGAAVAGTVAAAALLASCAGAPPARPVPESAFSALGPGARVYALCEIAPLRPLLEAAAVDEVGKRKLADALARTDAAAAAWFGGGDAAFRVNAFGRYPRAASHVSLTLDPSWKRVGGDKPYWRSASGLSLAFERDGSVLLSDGPPRPAAAGPVPPASFGLLDPAAAVRAWIPEPSAAVSRALGPAGASIRLPVAELALSLSESAGSWRAELVAASSGDREARALFAILRFARNLLRTDDPEPLKALLAKALRAEFSVEGSTLRAGLSLSSEEIARVLDGILGTLLYP